MNYKTIITIICLFAFCNPVLAKNLVLHYKPAVVTLTGIIKIKTFPGAPNYESVEAGDDIESGPYLILDHPIDIIATSKDDNDAAAETEKNQKIIQITNGDTKDNWKDKFIGKHVRVTGSFTHAVFGHHHTNILIEANHFEIAR